MDDRGRPPGSGLSSNVGLARAVAQAAAADRATSEPSAVRGSSRGRQPSAAISAASSSSVRPASWRERPSTATANMRPRRASADRGTRVAAVGDVGVELAVGGAEALAVLFAAEDGLAVADEQRAGLQQVAARRGGQLRRAARSRATPPSTCTHARTSSNGAVNGTCSRTTPRVRTSPSGVPCGRTKKPPTIASSTPCAAHHASSLAWPRSTRDAQLGARGVVGGDVDRRARAVLEVQAQAASGAGARCLGAGRCGGESHGLQNRR